MAEDTSGQTRLLVEIRASGAMTVASGCWHVTVGENLLLAVLAVVWWLVISTALNVGLI